MGDVNIPPLMELPPRARRIRGGTIGVVAVWGTTSACAENTVPKVTHHLLFRNYLRVRGEYIATTLTAFETTELPPRARRIHPGGGVAGFGYGTTSACAENTKRAKPLTPTIWNYLRVRGEYARASRHHGASTELPPRARRIPSLLSGVVMILGTTSACAENTLNELGLL